ncbi:MAG TPA: PQQ-binding-like beta-propeller repeat protein [Gammaproteobacteria bacterium]|nr:PQQ-binding-like beta-propeller repeat protein [Gammaproteobacteria bacterium]
MKLIHVVVASLPVLALTKAAFAQSAAPDGADVFQRVCAACHSAPAPDSRAPDREALGRLAPEAIVTTLTTGNMFRQGSALSTIEREAVAEFLAGRPVGAPSPPSDVGRCADVPPLADPDSLPGWNGWGNGVRNARYQPADRAGLTARQVPQLELKWAFGFPGVNSARAQPTVVSGRVFVGSENGEVYALDAKTGCTYWTFHARAGIRSAVSVGRYATNAASGYAAYFADMAATAYAVDAATGAELWRVKLDDHPYAGATGSPTFYDGRLYVPLSGVGEEGRGGQAAYECCTFRGSVTALDASTGAVVWKSYSIPEVPAPRGTNTQGGKTWGPAGGGIWSAPTVDARRGVIYVATGNGYSEPARETTDAVLALDMETGRILWSTQPIPNDIFAGGCQRERSDNPNCPAELGPDVDFSDSPLLATRSTGRDLIIVQQKAGIAYGFDPDARGALVWRYRTGEGSGLGGQWGAAVDGTRVYFGVADTLSPKPGGIRAVDIDTGKELWSKEAAEKLCGTQRGCSSAQGAAVTSIPGAVFSGSSDGGLRAYAGEDGTLIWQFDTNRTFETVNGVEAHGGAMDGPGAVVADGMVYVNSGYVSLIGRPGNVLLAFGVK